MRFRHLLFSIEDGDMDLATLANFLEIIAGKAQQQQCCAWKYFAGLSRSCSRGPTGCVA